MDTYSISVHEGEDPRRTHSGPIGGLSWVCIEECIPLFSLRGVLRGLREEGYEDEAILIEIKTPTTKLLGSKYRGTFRPSSELNGATVQVLDYRDALVKNLSSVTQSTGYDISTFSPRCVVIVGNGC